jgi:hypothetical protein
MKSPPSRESGPRQRRERSDADPRYETGENEIDQAG